MTAVDVVKTVIQQLSPEESSQLKSWYDEYEADKWDKQIETDAKSGKLDALTQQALRDFKNGKCTPL